MSNGAMMTDEQRQIIQTAADTAHRVLCAGGDYGDELSDAGLRSELKVSRDALRALLATAPLADAQICRACNGNDGDTPCAYPEGEQPGCLRDARLAQSDERAVLVRMANDMRAEQTFLGSCRETCDDSGRARWDRIQRVIDYLDRAQAPTTASSLTDDALRYIACRESAIERGLFATPDEYDAMVDDSLRKKGKEVLTGRGNNYGKKVAKDGSLSRPAESALTDEQRDTLKLAIGYIGSSTRDDRHEHIARIRALLREAGSASADAEDGQLSTESVDKPVDLTDALQATLKKWERWQADGEERGCPETNGMATAISDLRAILREAGSK
ncbi:hypothetical protein [Paraburkholderia atlantica]|uniref:hypothetical protein n=1 Tax=Paraburkholderia atlantica TaxID=2654982 RepID=UPI00160949E4|nr:hypothetical protein [Paraburkholderia atlantica]MBB5414046.1 hypothetical protein [Paraburkholderia atlantica]